MMGSATSTGVANEARARQAPSTPSAQRPRACAACRMCWSTSVVSQNAGTDRGSMKQAADERTTCLDAHVGPLRVITAAAMLTITGCTTGSQPPHPGGSSQGSPPVTSGTAPTHSVQLDCGEYIDAHRPVRGIQVVLGVVALPTSSAGPALGTARTGDPSVPRLFAKTGLLIKAGTDFRIVVPARAGDRLGIGWGSPATPNKTVVVSHCPRERLPSRWLAYAGGYWLDHPACVTVQVRTATQSQSVHLGLGAPCPGQAPPPEPSAM